MPSRVYATISPPPVSAMSAPGRPAATSCSSRWLIDSPEAR